MFLKRKLARENEALKSELRDTQELLHHSIESTKIGVLALAEQIAPTEEDLESLARDFPKWSISCETVGGGFNDKGTRKIVKEFKRNMDDLDPSLENDRETYLRFFDGELFDNGVRDAFRMASADPDMGWIPCYGSKAPGGGSITISVEGETGLTKLDLIRVKAVEQYLVRDGCLAEPLAA